MCRTLLLSCYLFASLAKSALAMLIIDNGLAEFFLCEVGPIDVCKIELRIGALPKQVIAQTLFTSCANHQFRVWHEVGGQMLTDGLLVDGIRSQFTFLYLLGYILHGLSDFPLR